MKLSEIITLIAGIIALFWTIVQIVAHARDKDSKNLKIALPIFLLILAVVGYLFISQTKTIPIPTITDSPKTIQTTPEKKIEPQKTGSLNSSFVIKIDRNMVGGVSDIKMDCIFSETGGLDIEIVSYKTEIEWQSKNKVLTKNFDKTLAERIQIPGNSSIEQELNIDSDMGDILLKARHDRLNGKINIIWNGIDSNGNKISAVSEGLLPR